VLPDEDWGEFAKLETALVEELVPQGALQSILVGRNARPTWPARPADRLEVEVFEVRGYANGSPGAGKAAKRTRAPRPSLQDPAGAGRGLTQTARGDGTLAPERTHAGTGRPARAPRSPTRRTRDFSRFQ
jgi:hypothetical protein